MWDAATKEEAQETSANIAALCCRSSNHVQSPSRMVFGLSELAIVAFHRPVQTVNKATSIASHM